MTVMCDSLTLQQVDDDAAFLRLEKTGDDVDWLNFLNVDMPGMFPDIKEELQDEEKIRSTDEEDAVVSDSPIVLATKTSIILADKLAAQTNAAASCRSNPSSHIPSEKLFLPVSPSSSVGSFLNVPNPLAGRCESPAPAPALSIAKVEERLPSTPPPTKTTVVGTKRNLLPAPVSPNPSVASSVTADSIASSPEPHKKKARVAELPASSLAIAKTTAAPPNKVATAPASSSIKSDSKKIQPTKTKVPAVKLTPKSSSVSTSSPALSKATDGDKKEDDEAPDSNMTEEEIEEEKRQRNRDHARRSRRKKKMIQIKLQESSIQLKNENSKLRDTIFSKLKIHQDEIDTIVQEKLELPQKNFILALKQPGNHTLNTRTIQFLQSHAKKANQLQKLSKEKQGKEAQEEEMFADDNQSKEESDEEKKL